MARKIKEIQDQIILSMAGETTLAPLLLNTSKVSNWRLLTFIMAVSINLFEQLLDIFKADIEGQIAKAPIGSSAWLQDKVFKFQYSVTPENVVIKDFTLQYVIVNEGKRIITRCAVLTTGNKEVIIKVAKGVTPQPLSAPEQSSLVSYVNSIGFAGINYTVISAPPDLLAIKARVYYSGQYSGVIKANIKTAINNYLATLPFNGQVLVMSLTDAIQKVTGVTNVVITFVKARASSTIYASATLVTDPANQTQSYAPYAGYLVEETTTGQDFDTLIETFAV